MREVGRRESHSRTLQPVPLRSGHGAAQGWQPAATQCVLTTQTMVFGRASHLTKNPPLIASPIPNNVNEQPSRVPDYLPTHISRRRDRTLFAARHDCAGLNVDAATAGVDEPAPRWLAAGLVRHQARRGQERLHLRQQLAERSQQVLQGV